MTTIQSDSDTIVAAATAAGPGAIAVVRLSGPRSRALLQKCFYRRSADETVNHFPHRRLVLGDFLEPGEEEPVDRVMAVLMPGPRSYTGEDVVEIHCHGSPAIVARIVDVLCRAGARPAQPGEFSRRAFVHGRIDLAQAEAVCDLVRSATDEAARLALRQLTGGLSRRLGEVHGWLVEFSAEIEARLDFPEEEIGEADRQALAGRLEQAGTALDDMLRQGRRGRCLREGVRIVLVGRPNVGKSSLLNALVGRERALVSPHPGTTRDTIECTLDLEGIAATLVDTAGWHAACSEIEHMGVERTQDEVEIADLLVWVVDGSQALTREDGAIAERIAALPVVVACNKSDLPPAVGDSMIEAAGFGADRICRVSALRVEGIDRLEQRVVALLLGGEKARDGETPLVSNARHLALIDRAREALQTASRAFDARLTGDLVMVDVRRALHALDEILGRRFDEEVLDRIFSRFCIGK